MMVYKRSCWPDKIKWWARFGLLPWSLTPVCKVSLLHLHTLTENLQYLVVSDTDWACHSNPFILAAHMLQPYQSVRLGFYQFALRRESPHSKVQFDTAAGLDLRYRGHTYWYWPAASGPFIRTATVELSGRENTNYQSVSICCLFVLVMLILHQIHTPPPTQQLNLKATVLPKTECCRLKF